MKDILLWFILLMPFNFIVIMCLIGVIMNKFKKIKLSDNLYQSIKRERK
jgi:TRAP-type mannitol/chloroaromatic compound transport system permease small subunit